LHKKTRSIRFGLPCFFLFAEVEGFEPPVPCGTSVFKTGAFDHSATPPLNNGAKIHTSSQIQSKYSLNLYIFSLPLLNDNSYYVKWVVILKSILYYSIEKQMYRENKPIDSFLINHSF
jgi:hypothetical protein